MGPLEPAAPTRLELPGGRTLTVRASGPGDADALEALYRSLSADDLYRRFFQAHTPPRKVVERVLSAAERDGVGLVAELEDTDGSRTIVGETSYELLPDGSGDLGITVGPRARGWLGPYLLDVLLTAARERGVTNVQADVLVENRRMMALVRSRGYATLDHYEQPAIVRVVMGTAGRTPPWPGPHHGTRVLAESPGGRWRAEGDARHAGLEVVVCPGPLGPGSYCPALAGAPCPLAAEADVIVDTIDPGTPAGRTLLEAHERLHGGVPVCIDLPGRREDAPPGPLDVVALVQRLAKKPPPP